MLSILLVQTLVAATEFNISAIPNTHTAPQARVYHQLEYSPLMNSLVTFGGYFSSNYFLNDLWMFSLTKLEWSRIVPVTSKVPAARINYGSFFDKNLNELYIFGGVTKKGAQNDLWKFSFKAQQWFMITSTNTPEARYRFGSTRVFTNDTYFQYAVFGGCLSQGWANDLHLFDLKSLKWTVQKAQGKMPPLMDNPMLISYNGFLYMAGGIAANETNPSLKYFNGTFRYNLAAQSWENITSKVTYPHRYLTGKALINNFMYLIFGWSNYENQEVKNIMRLNLTSTTYNWEEFDLNNPNDELVTRDSFGCTAIKDTIYLFSGYNEALGKNINSLAEINTTSSNWTEMTINQAFPNGRYLHSLEVMNGKFFLFGGLSNTVLYNDLWVFDPEINTWESFSALGTAPSARYGHSSAARGDIMIIWGGWSQTGLLRDMYNFNYLTSTWTEVTPDETTMPSGRMGACISMLLPKIFIYGGETASGISNEVWLYDTGTNAYTLLSPSNLMFSGSIYPVCEAVLEGKDILLYTIYGATDGEQPLGSIRIYNTTDNTWKEEIDPGVKLSNRALSIIQRFGSVYIIISGEQWSTDPYKDVYILDKNNGYEPVNIGTIPRYIYGSAFVYYKKSIYAHAGGSVIGNTMRTIIPSEDFFLIDLNQICVNSSLCQAQCSPGTYITIDGCELCKAGSYSDTYGANTCTLCPAGSFNSYNGANSNRQCYPCSEGSYNEHSGSSICLECPRGYSCPAGSKSPFINPLKSTVASIQPQIYSKSSAKANNANQILINVTIVVSVIVIVVFITFRKKLTRFVKLLDLFKSIHTYELYVPTTLQKTGWGGLCSILFMIIAIFIIASSVITFMLDNEDELKSLVPLVNLENEVSEFVSPIFIEIVLSRYGDVCSTNDKCTEGEIQLTTTGISNRGESYTCKMTEENDCIITYTCNHCIINQGASVELLASEKLSYSSALSVNITTDSSIPSSISSIYQLVTPPENTLFRGAVPTVFQFNIISSLFKYQVNDNNPQTGYHISTLNAVTIGSYYLINELPFTSDLKIKIELVLSSSSLYTLRYSKDTVIMLINGLLGSVFGIMSAFGAAMRFVEGGEIYLLKKRKTRSKMREVLAKHKQLSTDCNLESDGETKENL